LSRNHGQSGHGRTAGFSCPRKKNDAAKIALTFRTTQQSAVSQNVFTAKDAKDGKEKKDLPLICTDDTDEKAVSNQPPAKTFSPQGSKSQPCKCAACV
jgi:hypothetical protein